MMHIEKKAGDNAHDAYDAYELVPGKGKVFEEGGRKFYWNMANNGTVIERDLPRLKKTYGDKLVEMRTFGEFVMQKWRAD